MFGEREGIGGRDGELGDGGGLDVAESRRDSRGPFDIGDLGGRGGGASSCWSMLLSLVREDREGIGGGRGLEDLRPDLSEAANDFTEGATSSYFGISSGPGTFDIKALGGACILNRVAGSLYSSSESSSVNTVLRILVIVTVSPA